MMPEIFYSAEPYSKGIYYEKLSLGQSSSETYLTYYWSSQKGFWELEYLQTYPPSSRRKGYGSSLLREFVQRVGQAQLIHGAVIDDNTLAALSKIFPTFEYPTVLNKPLLAELPIVQLFARGGITVDSIHLSPLNSDSYESVPFGVDIYGQTSLG